MKSVRNRRLTKNPIKLKKKKLNCEVERMTDEEKIKVIQWFVELKSSVQIQELLKDLCGKEVSRVTIWRFSQRPRWRKLIKRLRGRFEREILKIPIANKSQRLRYYQIIVDEGFKWTTKSINEWGSVEELKLGAVTQALKEARVEMEGEKALVDNSQHIHFDVSKMDDESRAKFIQDKLNV